MSRFEIEPIGSLWVVGIAAAVMIGLLLVGPGRRRLANRQRWVLIALRGAVIALVLFAMLRPEVVFSQVRQLTSRLILLVDRSRSMQVTDALGNNSRWEAVTIQIDRSRDALAAVENSEVQIYTFDESLQPLAMDETGPVWPAAPEGDTTAIGAALDDVLRLEGSQRVLGVLLFSDGMQRAFPPRDIAAQTAVNAMADQAIPLYTFAAGTSGAARTADLAISELATNDVAYAEMPLEIRGQLRVRGFSGQPVQVQLAWESATRQMEIVDTQVFTPELDNRGQAMLPVQFSYTPPTAGEYKVSLTAVPLDGEMVTSNNTESTFVTVSKGGVAVLLLHGSQREAGSSSGPERVAVSRALAASPDMYVVDRLITYAPREVDLLEPFQKREFDVVLLLNVDVNGLSEASWQEIETWVNQGGGLLMAGGYHSFGAGGFAGTPIGDLLPITLNRNERQNFGEPIRQDVHLQGPVKLLPRPQVSHPITTLARAGKTNNQVWEALPPLLGANRFNPRGIKPGANVLAVAADDSTQPLLVVGGYGNGRVVAFAGDSTWRYRTYGFAAELARFWRQTVLWLAKKDEAAEGQVTIELAQRRLAPGSQASFSVVYQPPDEAEFTDDIVYKAELVLPDATTREMQLASRGGTTVGTSTALRTPGDYVVRVTAGSSAGLLGSGEARFIVLDRDVELDNPAADPDLLNHLAEMTAAAGGRALRLDQLPELVEELSSQSADLEEDVVEKLRLWDNWFILLFIAGLLSGEWYLRKRWGLV